MTAGANAILDIVDARGTRALEGNACGMGFHRNGEILASARRFEESVSG